MTPEELSAEADRAMSPAVERLICVAFNTLPAENVEAFVSWYMDLMKQVAVGAVREMIEERRQRPS